MVNATPRPLHPRERPGTHCIEGWKGPTAGLDRGGKTRPPPGFDTRTIQSVESRYTDWTITAQTKLQRNGQWCYTVYIPCVWLTRKYLFKLTGEIMNSKQLFIIARVISWNKYRIVNRQGAGLMRKWLQPPSNRNVKNIDLVDTMILNVLRNLPISRNHPLKSAND